MTAAPTPAIVVMARVPERGKVKTRLAAEVGADRALQVYVRLLGRTRVVTQAAAAATGATVYWAVTGRGAVDHFAAFATPVCVFEQTGDDLGTRMRHACERLLAGHSPVIIVGADSPDIEADDVVTALANTTDVQVTFIPSTDGGYVAIAMQTLAAAAFFDHGWGGPMVLKNSFAALCAAGFQPLCLPARHDLDDADDLRAFPWLESPLFRA